MDDRDWPPESHGVEPSAKIDSSLVKTHEIKINKKTTTEPETRQQNFQIHT
jgi:hypothetical protein